jgi:D-alanyl-D-alanine carboxypeptidase
LKLYILVLSIVLLLLSCNIVDSLSDQLPSGYYDTVAPTGVDIIENPNSDIYQEYLNSYVKQGLPGAIVLIDSPEGLWIGSAGKCDIKRDVKMDPFSISRIGSFTKMFFSVVILKLVDQNLLNLDDKIDQYIPAEMKKNIANADTATIRQILNHTSGIINDSGEINNSLDWIWDSPETFRSLDDCIKTSYGKPAYFAPGEGWHYSNINYHLLSYIIKSVTGEDHWEVLRSEILDVLGLNYTYYYPENIIPVGTARGYCDMYGNGTIYEITDYLTMYTSPAAGIVTTPYDAMLFLKGVFTSSLLQPSTLEELMDTVAITDEISDINAVGYGLGLMAWSTDYGFAYGHGGQVWGYRSDGFYFPDQNTTIVIFVNGAYNNIGKIMSEMRDGLPNLIFGSN